MQFVDRMLSSLKSNYEVKGDGVMGIVSLYSSNCSQHSQHPIYASESSQHKFQVFYAGLEGHPD